MDLDPVESYTEEIGKEIKITEDGGVLKTVLTAGTGWDCPERGDQVEVHYVGTLASDGSEFDSSRGRNDTFKFKLGEGQVIKGWDEGVATMKKGEKSILTCKPEYAYGKSGSPPKIPADATLNFEVELLSWKSVKDIMGDGGIIKTVVADGSGWNTPRDQDEVRVKYVVRAKGEEKPLLSSAEEGDEFDLRAQLPVLAFKHVIPSMKKGEKVKLVIQPNYGLPAEAPAGAELEAELELVAWKTVTAITKDGGVVKKTLKEAEGYKTPNRDAKVKLRGTALLLPAGVDPKRVSEDAPLVAFDKFEEGSELAFTVDEGEVVDGLEKAVQKMKVGEVAEITISPAYGWGAQEVKRGLATVPPNSMLIYTLELVACEQAKEKWELKEDSEKVAEAAARKESGNAAFKAGRWSLAVRKYAHALEFLDPDKDFAEPAKTASRDIQRSCNLNLAAAHLKLGDNAEAIKAASKVLDHDGSNVKALYRRAQAHLALQDIVEAEADIKAALVAEPGNRDVRALSAQFKRVAAEASKRERKMFGNIFERMSAADARHAKKEKVSAENGGQQANAQPPAAAEEAGPSSEPTAMEADIP